MITRQTTLDQPELNRSGLLQIRIALLLIEDGNEIDCKWHRTAVPLDGDVQQQMDLVNLHLAQMEPAMPPVPQDEIEHLKACHTLLKQRIGILE